MVILEKGKYIVHIPELGLWQDVNPEKSQLPFQSKEEAETWEAAYLVRIDDAKQEYDLGLALAEEAAIAAEAAAKAAVPGIDIAKLADADFKKMVLTALGYKIKEA